MYYDLNSEFCVASILNFTWNDKHLQLNSMLFIIDVILHSNHFSASNRLHVEINRVSDQNVH